MPVIYDTLTRAVFVKSVFESVDRRCINKPRWQTIPKMLITLQLNNRPTFDDHISNSIYSILF